MTLPLGHWQTIEIATQAALEHGVAVDVQMVGRDGCRHERIAISYKLSGLLGGDVLQHHPQLRELGQTRAGYVRGSQFVFSQHCKSCRSVGLTDEQISAIPHWSVSDGFTAVQRAVLAYTDALVLEGGRVPDPVFAALKDNLSDEAILELTYVTTLYDMHATMARALRLEYDDVDERIVEVPAPSEAANRDVMAVVDGDRN